MIIGLLDPRWETRHGCSLGLMGLLQGLGLVVGPNLDLVPTQDQNSVRILGQDSCLDSTELNPLRLNFMSPKLEEKSTINLNNMNHYSKEMATLDLDDGSVLPMKTTSSSSNSTAFVSSYPSSSSSIPTFSLSLPQYLVEDIICTGLCLLMLDRFIDLSTSSSISISPAKEVREYYFFGKNNDNDNDNDNDEHNKTKISFEIKNIWIRNIN